ncbi:asparagine synthase (glutamine-hydrolyzing) [Peribacillus muralis]|uniref:asparagine synthase (glutamine-hydrolyzing) n=1 Tax=Peribacillus muralis TaxID=264697 RepID=UPI0038149AA7
MCGISGFFGRDDNKPLYVKSCLNEMKHRGPDDCSIAEFDEIAMGTVRLSIRDSSEKANQPFVSSSGRWIITFNGEINNFQQLRHELKHCWATECDTEVLAELFEAFGKEGLQKLKGMYAIAAFDKHTDKLFLARDFPGIKPLYWMKTKTGAYIYASEFPALLNTLKALNEDCEMTKDQVYEYLMYRDTLLEPNTLIDSIKKVSPGEILELSLDKGVISSKVSDVNEKNEPMDLERLFTKAITSVIEPKQKMGMFLSGGVDSSTVLSELVSQGANVEAITLRYEKTGAFSYSEVPFSKYVCGFLNVPLHEVILKEQDFIDLLPQALANQDGLSMDPTIVAYYALGEAAEKKGLKTVITGTGSDEIFGSYDWLHSDSIEQFDHWMKSATTKNLLRLDDQAWKNISDSSFQDRKHKIETFMSAGGNLGDAIRLFGFYHLEADALPRVDLGTMNSSVECRVPLLDQDFVHAALSMPPDKEKSLFRSLSKNRIPLEIQQRPKCGFPHPVFIWMKHGELGRVAYDFLKVSQLKDVINFEELDKFLNDGSSLLGRNPSAHLYDLGSSFWYLYSFALWCEIHKVKLPNLKQRKEVYYEN